MTGRSDITLKNNIIIVIVNIILNYLLIPKYGIIGAAFATGFALVLMASIVIVEEYYLLKIHPFSLNLLKPIVVGLASLIVIVFLQKYLFIAGNILQMILLSVFFLIYYPLIYYFMTSEEDLYIKEAIKRKLSNLF